ncbi:MAG: 50S ribosomal protein L21 [Bacteroidia bacterium]|nr:50S ribosomal protein L21 [Bacteroidia bacterium]
MYVIVNIQGSQFKVEEGQEIFVNRMSEDTGSTVELSEVLLVDNEGSVMIGTPFVEGASVTVKVVDHLKDDKVIVFKKKRRKGYRVKNGHRQSLSKIEIAAIKA